MRRSQDRIGSQQTLGRPRMSEAFRCETANLTFSGVRKLEETMMEFAPGLEIQLALARGAVRYAWWV